MPLKTRGLRYIKNSLRSHLEGCNSSFLMDFWSFTCLLQTISICSVENVVKLWFVPLFASWVFQMLSFSILEKTAVRLIVSKLISSGLVPNGKLNCWYSKYPHFSNNIFNFNFNNFIYESMTLLWILIISKRNRCPFKFGNLWRPRWTVSES